MSAREPREFSGAVISLLFTDIEGSTALWEATPAAMSEALARHDALLRRTIESHDGRVFKTVGDAFCAVFESTHNAVAAAVGRSTGAHGPDVACRDRGARPDGGARRRVRAARRRFLRTHRQSRRPPTGDRPRWPSSAVGHGRGIGRRSRLLPT